MKEILFRKLIPILLLVFMVALATTGCVRNHPPVVESTINIEETTIPTTEPSMPMETEPEHEMFLIDNSSKYIGVYAEDPKEVDVFEDSLQILAWFDTFNRVSSTKMSMCLDEHKYIAFITLEPDDIPLREIAKGKHDEKIINYLKLLSEGERIYTELFVRFAHEMEMRPGYESWYSWQTHDADGYINAWRHLVSLGKEYAPNVKWVWSPNRADKYTKAYYPGDEYVDYVGLTLNNTRKSYKTFGKFYEKLGKKENLEAYNKPIILGEIAEHCLDDKQKNDYIASVFDYLKTSTNIVGVVFLNKDIERQRQYRFSDNETQIKTFIEKAKELRDYEEIY